MSNPIIHKAKTQLERLSSDEQTEALARQREEWLQLDCMERFLAREEALQEGMEKGMEKGLEQGLVAARTAMMALLTSRGWIVTDEVRATIGGCREPAVLLSWVTRAGTAQDLGDVFA